MTAPLRAHLVLEKNTPSAFLTELFDAIQYDTEFLRRLVDVPAVAPEASGKWISSTSLRTSTASRNLVLHPPG